MYYDTIESVRDYRRVSYPGELGVPPVGVAFEAPAGWTTGPVVGALAATREAAAGPEGFWANIVTSIDRVAAAASLDRISRDLLTDSQASSTSLVVTDERVVEVSGVPAIVREQTMQVDATPLELVQLSLLLLVDVGGGAARDCVQITASIETARRDLLTSVFDHLIGTLELDA